MDLFNLNLLSPISIILNLAVLAGSLYAFHRSRKGTTIQIQDETIVALSQQIVAIKDDLAKLREENITLRQTIETIKAALLTKGIHVTIDGDMVVVSDATTISSIPKKPRTQKTKEAAE